MGSESSPPTATIPINITQPADHAPPTLAEPASGTVAEMSGALHTDEMPHEASTEAAITSSEIPGVNGVAGPPPQSSEEKPEIPSDPATTTAEAEKTSEDTEMKDDAVAAPADASVVHENSETPARKSSNGKRKSTGGVPEHKSKKLNKKKSMPKLTNLDATPGDYYFARLKSYPPWPSIVCDEEMLPASLLSTRPVTTKKEDGTYREAYADGGKKAAERTFPVMFLHTNEFAWVPNTELTPLDPSECKDVTEKGKSKTLIAAYHVAEEGHNLQYFKDMLADHAKAIQEDEEMKEAKAAEKASKSEKKKRKSSTAADLVDDDVEMEDADDAGETKKSSKKRKKEAEAEDEDDEEKPAKTPKTTKLKLTNSKTPITDKRTKESAKEKKPKSEKKKLKTTATDEDVADSEDKEPEKPVDPVEERKAREKEVLFLRHKLQKGFLSRDQAPQEDEMPQMANYIKKLENYGELDVGIIRTTKINKVLKALIKLNTIPKDEEFNFRSRSMELLNKWNKILGSDNTDDAGADKEPEPATNGVHTEEAEKPMSTEPTSAAVSEPAEPAESKEDVKPTVEADVAAPAEPEEPSKMDAIPSVPEPTKVESAAEPASAPQQESVPVTSMEETDIKKATE